MAKKEKPLVTALICVCINNLRRNRLDILTVRMSKKKLKKTTKKKSAPPSSYTSMPYYFPTEQVDIVRKVRTKKRAKHR